MALEAFGLDPSTLLAADELGAAVFHAVLKRAVDLQSERRKSEIKAQAIETANALGRVLSPKKR